MEEHIGSWLNFIVNAEPEAWKSWLNINVLSGWFVIVALLLFVLVGTRRLELRPTSKLQVFWEWAVEGFKGFCLNIIGPGGERFAPLMGTLFLYIAGMNLLGVIPGFYSPTSSLTMTLSLSLPVILYVQYVGFATQGWRYVLHFVGDPWWLFPLNLPIHLVGDVARLFSLAIRLFGNIFGEDTVIAQLLLMGVSFFKLTHVPFPLHFLMILFHIFISFVQAMVFMMLTAAYISGAIGHGHDDAEAHGAGHDEAVKAG